MTKLKKKKKWKENFTLTYDAEKDGCDQNINVFKLKTHWIVM